MIQESDNIAALVLLNAVGAEQVNSTLDKLGLRGTHVVDRRLGDQGDNVTTARDMGTLLKTIEGASKTARKLSTCVRFW